MITIDLDLGYTLPADGYVPEVDGFRPGALQRVIRLTRVQLHGLHPGDHMTIDEAARIAERVFDASTSRTPAELSGLTATIRAMLDAQEQLHATAGEPLRQLTVGDTVSLMGFTLAIESWGWTRISMAP